MSEARQADEKVPHNDAQTNLLLVTKLTTPTPRHDLVVRSRLLSRLQVGWQRSLLLVIAPAGYGKTTVLSTWLATCAQPAAWIALDKNDNDPLRFWSYVIVALDTLGVDNIKQLLSSLDAQQFSSTEAFSIALLNTLATCQKHILLVLDDYHLITTDEIHTTMQFLIEHLPSHVHIIISARNEPPLSLSRLRAQGEVTELGVRDLRFTDDEAASLFTHKMKLDLSSTQISQLRERTEGWAAGLQLAALSLQQWNEPASFVAAFSASNRYIFDYFTEEVLRGQPAVIQEFLLQTSLLDRMSGPLCNAVTGQSGGEKMLMALERANLFVLATDPQRRWYRYHQLFADLLYRLLRERHPEEVPILHRRAALWYEENGQGTEAINHALAAADVHLAARLIETFTMSTSWYGGAVTRRAWLAALPDEVVRSRPRLCVLHALNCMEQNLFAAAEPALQDAEATYTTLDESEQQALLGEIAAIRSTIAINLGNYTQAAEPAERALQLLPRDDKRFQATIGQVVLNLADSCLNNANQARHLYIEAVTLNRAAGNLATAVTAMSGLGSNCALRGNLYEAEQILMDALKLGRETLLAWPSTGKAHISLGAVYYEWNRLEEAMLHIEEGIQHCQQWRHIYHLGEGLLLQAQVQAAQGRIEAGLATLAYGKRLVDEATLGASGPISIPRFQALSIRFAMKRIDLLLMRDDVTEATRTADQSGFSLTIHSDRVSAEHNATLMRLLLASGKMNVARDFLTTNDSHIETSKREGWIGEAIKAQLVQGAILEASGATARALLYVEQALKLAETAHYIRTFLDIYPPIQHLLLKVLERGTGSVDYISLLLNAFKTRQDGDRPAQAMLADPLSDRELAVLRLLAVNLSSSEIAAHLIIGVSTVRTHIKHIYTKLNVHSSAEAIARARILRLI